MNLHSYKQWTAWVVVGIIYAFVVHGMVVNLKEPSVAKIPRGTCSLPDVCQQYESEFSQKIEINNQIFNADERYGIESALKKNNTHITYSHSPYLTYSNRIYWGQTPKQINPNQDILSQCMQEINWCGWLKFREKLDLWEKNKWITFVWYGVLTLLAGLVGQGCAICFKRRFFILPYFVSGAVFLANGEQLVALLQMIFLSIVPHGA
ncbi:MAG: hypothetical protein AAB932_00665 [Patescibacteria group bacterium]